MRTGRQRKWPEAATRARWAERGSSTSSASLSLPILAQLGWCSCLRTSSRRVAAEWPLGVRVVMAGYEYVSPEQLAGFDKYKVAPGPADAPLPPLPGLSQAAEGQARFVSPCAAWLRAGWRAFLRGSCRDLELWGQGAWGHPRPAALTWYPPGGLPFP